MLKEEKWTHPILLGKGAFSQVYRVTNEATGELAVCKITSRPELAKGEAQLLQKIRHPLFPKYLGQRQEAGRYFLYMEYICGCELRQYVERRGSLSPERAVEIVLELAQGLNYLHEQPEPVIFRDVKPENVMIQQDGRVRLVDVGCAYVSGTGDGSRAGTKGYAAPEQLLEDVELGRESDVYALGKLLEYMLKGRKRISKDLLQLIKRATRENPRQRIPDMRTFMLQLEGYEECGFYYKKNIYKES